MVFKEPLLDTLVNTLGINYAGLTLILIWAAGGVYDFWNIE
jgi:hypothetical protein